MSDRRLPVVLCWHMHQPQYRDLATGVYEQPWTYLHAIKDYVDMAAHLEEAPLARAVVNLTPILLEQISDYDSQLTGFLKQGMPVRDPLLGALAGQIPSDEAGQRAVMRACLRAHRTRMIDRFPAYQQLAAVAERVEQGEEHVLHLSRTYFTDLVTWYHLAWLGETVRRSDPVVGALIARAQGFTDAERLGLLGVIAGLIGGLIGRYRRLAESGRIELSFTPYAHPILPLLLDLESAREAQPEVSLPAITSYPGGEASARRQIALGLDLFERHFGFRPAGCWPAEGALSAASLRLLSGSGFRWAATGANVLRNSLDPGAGGTGAGASCLHRGYVLAGSDVACFFRDDGLSDLIGFTYADWHADDAVANLVHHLEQIAETCADQEDAVVSIILDGENAWEYYPDNGYHFLSALYQRLTQHPQLRMSTFSGFLDQPRGLAPLPRLVAGSWVYGTFSTWIGDADKNRAWDLLIAAKRCADEVLAEGGCTPEMRLAIERQMAVCEASDWFWWFGDYNPADSVHDFDHLYRGHLRNLYALMGRDAPEVLSHVFARGRGTPALGGTMRRGAEG